VGILCNHEGGIRNKLCSGSPATDNWAEKAINFNEFRGKIYDILEKLGL
jgi:hypothetical protein